MRNDAPNSAAASEYVARVNRAIDHVVRHLSEPLRLDDVARVACFSPFHFHRIFRSLMGETLAQFVKRQRLERALYSMAHEPERSLTEIALATGFSTSSDFSRNFKQRFGVPPSEFDLEAHRRTRRAELQGTTADPSVSESLRGLPPGENPDGFEVELVDLPARTVAYLRVLEPFEGMAVPAAGERFVAWAEKRGLADGQWLGYMWEDPDLVPLKHCRYDIGLVVGDAPFRAEGEVGRAEFAPMKVAQVSVAGPIDLEQRALDWLFKTWLPRSGFAPAEQPCFEAWRGRPFAHRLEHYELWVQLPVTRM